MKQTPWDATDAILFFFSGEISPLFTVQLYLKVEKAVLDYILDILYLYDGTIPY
jgi:hypothetical protein